ncbi:MAG: hypothetical protein WCB68_19255 [Pyrinomonadaceae bacterium]
MMEHKATIFRKEAWQRYMTRNEKAIFPKLVAPRTFIYLWLILTLLSIGGLFALFADIPIYAPALAVVVQETGSQEQDSKEARVALFVAPEYLSQLNVHQRVFFKMNRGDELVSRQIVAIEPHVLSPSAAQKRFALGGNAAAKINESAAVAFVPLEQLPGGTDAASYLGTTYDARVEIGTQRLVQFLPLIGRFFDTRSHKVETPPASSSIATR